MTFKNHFTHLDCSATGERYEKDRPHNLSAAGKPLLARYDLAKAKAEIDRDEIWARDGGFWKWRELLPVERDEDVLRLGEVDTPLIDIPVSAKLAGATGRVIVKDESRLPTASFKARGLALGVSMAKSFGLTKLAMPTAGNAGAAMSAYAKRGGMEAFVFCPEDAPDVNVQETCLQGGKVFRVNGLIHHCGALVGAGKEAMGWFDLSTLKEPYRAEGKKTMGLELAAQMGWRLPEAIFYPTGGGTGLIGMWKAFDEMEQLGWIGPERPKMFAVQSTGCAPIVKAFNEGKDHAEEWMDADTMAAGMRVPKAVADFLILRAVRESGGAALAVTDDHIQTCWHRIGAADGLLMGPEGSATYAAMEMAMADGLIERDAEVVLYNCGSGLKFNMPDTSRKLDRHNEIDWRSL